MYPRDGDCGVHGMGERIFEEVCVCPTKDAYIVKIELNVDDVLVVRASDGDCGGESGFFPGCPWWLSWRMCWGLSWR